MRTMLALFALLAIAGCGSDPTALDSATGAQAGGCLLLTSDTSGGNACVARGYAYLGESFNDPSQPACASGPKYRVAFVSDGEVIAVSMDGVNARHEWVDGVRSTTQYPFRFFFAASVSDGATGQVFAWSPGADDSLHPIAGTVRLELMGTIVRGVRLDTEVADLEVPATCGGGALRWIDAEVDGGSAEPDLIEFLERARSSM